VRCDDRPVSDPAADLHTADEATMLHGWADRQREQVAGLLDDLTDAEARTRLVPSLTTPLGLVTHATFVEQVWFHHRLAGRTRAEVGVPETVDESFTVPTDATVASVRAAYGAACSRSREICAGRPLDEEMDWRGTPVTLRYVLHHLVAELARHAGQGDILVEQLRAARG